VILRKAALAAMMLSGTADAALADSDHLDFSSEPSVALENARRHFETASGATIDTGAVTISEVDLDGDGTREIIAYANVPAFCNADGCAPSILRREGESWKDILATDVVRTRAVPGNISVINERHGGFLDLLVGSLYLIHDGTAYREDTGPVPTTLDATAFLSACSGNTDIAREVRDAAPRGDVAEPVDTFCLCLVDQFQTAGLKQGDLDSFAALLAGRTDMAEAAKQSSLPGDFEEKLGDFRFSCGIELSAD
jgi:hypothetical protein